MDDGNIEGLPMKHCPICDKEIPYRKKFCSNSCSNINRGRLRIPQYTCVCVVCGKEYYNKRRGHGNEGTYCCSHECGWKLHAKKRENGVVIGKSCNVYFQQCLYCGSAFTSKLKRMFCNENCFVMKRREEYKEKHFKISVCIWCKKEFVGEYEIGKVGYNTRCCSVGCRKEAYHSNRMKNGRIAKHKRKALIRGVYVERVNHIEVFMRDGWKCQICGKQLKKESKVPHLLAATLDHVIPLNRGGVHSRSNTQCACFMCNSLKRDQMAEAV